MGPCSPTCYRVQRSLLALTNASVTTHAGSLTFSSGSEYDVEGFEDDHNSIYTNNDVQDCKPQDLDLLNSEVQECKPQDFDHFNVGTSNEGVSVLQVGDNVDFIRKRKLPQESPLEDQKVYTCPHEQCPYHERQLGFSDQSLRNAHQSTCAYRTDLQFANSAVEAWWHKVILCKRPELFILTIFADWYA